MNKSSLLLASIFFVSACNVDPFSLFGSGGDAGNGIDDDGGANGNGADAGPTIDGGDNGMTPDAAVDPCEGIDFQTNPFHCGGCGQVCVSKAGAVPGCVAGECVYTCLSNFHDLNGNLNTPGGSCEYGPCFITGEESCNLIDDDCNGVIDDIDPDILNTDVMNCGACFNQCVFINVEQILCDEGECAYTACKPGFNDVAEFPKGCEYQCPHGEALPEECNGIDDDCDGIIDNLPPGALGDECYPDGVAGCTENQDGTFACEGICQTGEPTCSFGVEVCSGFVTPQLERCDDIDWDCDGDPRNGFDTLNDPNHCGDACLRCKSVSQFTGPDGEPAPGEFLNAIPRCSAGVCTVAPGTADCLPGFVNNDPTIPGCEYFCTAVSDFEFCNGKDDTCDGEIDNDFFVPDGFDCSIPDTPCDGVPVSCTTCGGLTTLRCDYRVAQGGGAADPRIETDSCGNLLFQETRCDAFDNDCDGLIDEAFPAARVAGIRDGLPCDDGEQGICKSIGEFVCNEAEDGVACEIDPENPAHTIGLEPRAEECNNLDDDCDGVVDNFDTTPGVGPNELVGIDTSGNSLPDYFIFKYEASRPDARDDAIGIAGHKACSKPDVLPWVNVTWSQAEIACTNAGGRLCTAAEWQRACEGASGTRYPYGQSYEALSCNGHDYHHCPGPGDPANQESLLPTGFDYECPPVADTCASADGVYDLSGNAKEWIADESTSSPGAFGVRGGAFDNVAAALTCDNAFLFFQDATSFPNLGFRCCLDAP